MKRILTILFVVLLASFAASAQQTYTNSKQNFTINLPGTPTVGDRDTEFYLISMNYDSTFGVSVDAPSDKVSAGRAAVDAYVNSISETASLYGCKDNTYNGDPTALCDWSSTNDTGVRIHGKMWVVNHNGWLYLVSTIAAVTGTHDNETELITPINSFEFLQ